MFGAQYCCLGLHHLREDFHRFNSHLPVSMGGRGRPAARAGPSPKSKKTRSRTAAATEVSPAPKKPRGRPKALHQSKADASPEENIAPKAKKSRAKTTAKAAATTREDLAPPAAPSAPANDMEEIRRMFGTLSDRLAAVEKPAPAAVSPVPTTSKGPRRRVRVEDVSIAEEDSESEEDTPPLRKPRGSRARPGPLLVAPSPATTRRTSSR